MERWQKIETVIADFLRNNHFEVHRNGDFFVDFGDDELISITELAKLIADEIK